MNNPQKFENILYLAIDTSASHKDRSDAVMYLFYLSRSGIKGMMGILDNLESSDPIYIMIQQNLEALTGTIQEYSEE